MGHVILHPDGSRTWVGDPPTEAEIAAAEAGLMRVAEALGRLMARREVEGRSEPPPSGGEQTDQARRRPRRKVGTASSPAPMRASVVRRS